MPKSAVGAGAKPRATGETAPDGSAIVSVLESDNWTWGFFGTFASNYGEELAPEA